MARRRNKEADLISAAGSLAGLVVLAMMISPQIRQNIVGLGVLALGVFGVAALGLVGWVAYRRLDRAAEPISVERNITWDSPRLSVSVSHPEPVAPASLITQLRSMDWYQFEKIVALLYRKQGYIVTARGGANPDGGIDLIIEKAGQRTAVQCKQWKTWNVGVKAVREFLGALKDAGIDRGIFITLKGYSGDAKSLADKHCIEIVNETGLAKMLEATDAQFDPEALTILRDEQKHCPKCENKTVLRTAKKGNLAGQQFWGCSNYPKCRFRLEA